MHLQHGVSRPPAAPAHVRYLAVLTCLFALFNAARLVSYLPTLWAIWSVGDSQQHSLLTWLIWTGANVTMATWLYEQDGRRVTRSVAVNACNAAMCVATSVLIVAVRT
jgi:hypothetical protein